MCMLVGCLLQYVHAGRVFISVCACCRVFIAVCACWSGVLQQVLDKWLYFCKFYNGSYDFRQEKCNSL